MPTAYYNENDPFATAWLRNLIAAGLIAPGDVDERSIVDVRPADLVGYVQIHLFAGIGGWSYALRLAGWPDDRPVWTGSCPCQPFSAAGKQKGTSDERHLWPEMRRLLTERRPATVFGEQVASRLGREWLVRVRADLENVGYAVGAADLCAASVGAPHIRQRLWWVADAKSGRYREHERNAGAMGISPAVGQSEKQKLRRPTQAPRNCGEADGLGDADRARHEIGTRLAGNDATPTGTASRQALEQASPGNFWSSAALIPCADGKARRVEPSIFPLADGVPNRVGLLRGSGNAIVSQTAKAFIEAYMSLQP